MLNIAYIITGIIILAISIVIFWHVKTHSSLSNKSQPLYFFVMLLSLALYIAAGFLINN